jgi:predicted metal-binding membrane protein
MGNKIVGILMIVVGFLMVWKSFSLLKTFGRIDWAEEKWGTGASNLLYKLLGLMLITIGIMIFANLLGPSFMSNFGSFFSAINY